MGRKILLGLFLVFVCVVLVAGILWFQRTRLLGHYLSTALGSPVSVSSMSLEWQKIKLYGVTIDNPPGSVVQEAFFAEQIKLPISPWQLLSGDIQSPALVIKHAVLGVEFFNKEGSDTNWNAILKRMRAQDQGLTVDFETIVFDHLTLSCYSYPLERRLRAASYHRLELRPIQEPTSLPLSLATEALFQTTLAEVSTQSTLPPGMQSSFSSPSPYKVFLRFLEP